MPGFPSLKKLGQGWQYTAYDLGNGRVLKKSNSWPRAFFIISKGIFPFRRYPIWRVPAYITSARQKAAQSLKILETRNDIPLAWLANPVRLRGLDYEQDKTVPLHKILQSTSTQEGKRLIDLSIAFQVKLLQHQIIDKYFNLSKNFGLNEKEEVVLMDIGELVEDEEAILECRRARLWAEPFIANCINDDLRSHFIKEMDTYLGIQDHAE